MFGVKIKPISVKNRTKRKVNIPKSIIIYFLTPQLLLGIDYGFTKAFKVKFRKLIKRISITMSLITTVILLGPLLNDYSDIWAWFNLTEYVLYLLALNFAKYNIYEFVLDSIQIYELTATENIILQIISLYSSIILVIIKILILIAKCLYKFEEYCPMYKVPYYLFYFAPALGQDFFGMSQIIIVYYLYCCIKHLKMTLKKSHFSVTILQNQYIAIANCYDKIKPLYDNFVSITRV